jgi:tetratricopeptide (TPR) repeat protein
MGNVFNDRWTLTREFHPEWGDKETDEPWTEIDPAKKGRVDPERSISKYQDVWKLAPNYVQSHHQAGVVYMKLGTYFKNNGDTQKSVYCFNKALECFWKYHKIDPIFPVNYQRMAWVYMQLGNMEMAEKMYKAHLFTQWLCQSPEDVINPKKISTEEEKQKYEELKKQFEEESQWVCCDYHKRQHYLLSTEDWAKRRAQEYSDSYLQLGNFYYVKKNYQEAEKFYTRAINRYEQNFNAWKNLIVLYKETNQTQKLTELINYYHKKFPSDTQLSNLR